MDSIDWKLHESVEDKMKTVVVGGTGFSGSRIVSALRSSGIEVVVASRSTGFDAMTGAGIDDAFAGATSVIDVTNAPSYDENEIREFFDVAPRNLCEAAVRHGIEHYLLLSIVGVDRMAGSPYMNGKLQQEKTLTESDVGYTILRATQFYEFLKQFAEFFADNGKVRLPAVRSQALAVDDVAECVAKLIQQPAENKTIDLAGPQQFQLVDLVKQIVQANGDDRPVFEDEDALYFGTKLVETALVPSGEYLSGNKTFTQWLNVSGA